MSVKVHPESYDVIIAGAGWAGILAMLRLRVLHPECRILILDRLKRPGGRCRSFSEQAGSGTEVRQTWGLGFESITQDLYNFFLRSIVGLFDDEDQDFLAAFNQLKSSSRRMSLLSGKEWTEISTSELLTRSVAKTLVGQGGLTDWDEFENVLKDTPEIDSQQALSQRIKISKKNPNSSLPFLDFFSNPLGIAEMQSSTVSSIRERSEYINSCTVHADWSHIFHSVLEHKKIAESVIFQADCLIVDSTYHKDSSTWELQTEQGSYRGQSLIIAQSPWEALEWIDQAQCPPLFISMAQKFQPVSMVSLSFVLDQVLPFLDTAFVLSEKVQAVRQNGNVLCLQAVVDFEQSLDAPNVLKAIKRLKRAFKKISAATEQELNGRQEYLALHSVAWAQSTHNFYKKYVSGLDLLKLNTASLSFCGEAYGSSYHPERNIIQSLLSVCAAMEKLQG